MALSTLVDKSALGRRIAITGNSTNIEKLNGNVRWVEVVLDNLAAYPAGGYDYTALEVQQLFGMGRIDAVLIPDCDYEGNPVAVNEVLEFDLTDPEGNVTMTVKGASTSATFTGSQWLILMGVT